MDIVISLNGKDVMNRLSKKDNYNTQLKKDIKGVIIYT